MRGDLVDNEGMFSYLTPAQRVPKDHALRPIRLLVDEVLIELSPVFQRMYARTGRPSIPPERLIRALLLMMLYSIRSERQLMEQINFNILFRWFVGLGLDDRIWDVTVFSKNRQRLLGSEIDVKFFEGILARAREKGLLSEEHFTVDGTLIEAWASQKSFQKKDRPTLPPDDDPGNPSVDFRARSGRTTLTNPRPILRRGCGARPVGMRPSCASWATRSWRTATVSPSPAARASLRVAPSGRSLSI